MRQILIMAALLLSGAACRADAPVSETPLQVASDHFRLRYYGLDTGIAFGVLRHMEGNRLRVMKDLSVDSMPVVQVMMHTDSSFAERWGSVIRRSGVQFQVQGLASGVDEIHVYGPWAVRHPGALNSVVLHEFAHAVTLRYALLQGDSSHARPITAATVSEPAPDRWLAEAIALYEAGQSTDVNWVRPMRNGNYPTLAELNDPANSTVYGVGYRLIEYVRLKWGADGVTRLILAHGDVQQALGVTPTAFEDAWYDWIVERYLLLSPRLFGSSRYSRRVH